MSQQPTEAERLYTIKEAAHLFGLSTGAWFYDQIQAGDLEYVDLNPSGARPKIRLRASTLNKLADRFTYNKQPEIRSVA